MYVPYARDNEDQENFALLLLQEKGVEGDLGYVLKPYM